MCRRTPLSGTNLCREMAAQACYKPNVNGFDSLPCGNLDTRITVTRNRGLSRSRPLLHTFVAGPLLQTLVKGLSHRFCYKPCRKKAARACYKPDVVEALIYVHILQVSTLCYASGYLSRAPEVGNSQYSTMYTWNEERVCAIVQAPTCRRPAPPGLIA